MSSQSNESNEDDDEQQRQEKISNFNNNDNVKDNNRNKYRSKRTKFQRMNSPPIPILELNYTNPLNNGMKTSKLTVRMKNLTNRKKKLAKKYSSLNVGVDVDDDNDSDGESVRFGRQGRRKASRLSRLSRNRFYSNRSISGGRGGGMRRMESKRSVSLSKTSIQRARQLFVKHLEQIIMESMSKLMIKQQRKNREPSSSSSSSVRRTKTRTKTMTPIKNRRRLLSRKSRKTLVQKKHNNRPWKSMTKISSKQMLLTKTPDERKTMMPREEIEKIIQTIKILKPKSIDDFDEKTLPSLPSSSSSSLSTALSSSTLSTSESSTTQQLLPEKKQSIIDQNSDNDNDDHDHGNKNSTSKISKLTNESKIQTIIKIKTAKFSNESKSIDNDSNNSSSSSSGNKKCNDNDDKPIKSKKLIENSSSNINVDSSGNMNIDGKAEESSTKKTKIIVEKKCENQKIQSTNLSDNNKVIDDDDEKISKQNNNKLLAIKMNDDDENSGGKKTPTTTTKMEKVDEKK